MATAADFDLGLLHLHHHLSIQPLIHLDAHSLSPPHGAHSPSLVPLDKKQTKSQRDVQFLKMQILEIHLVRIMGHCRAHVRA